MSEKYDKPCFDVMDNEGVVECLEGTDNAGECCKDATKCNAWATCSSGKLSPRYAEYAAKHTGRRVIVDVEGLKEAIRERSVRYIGLSDATVECNEIESIIDSHTITAPDLVRREDVVDKNNQYYIGDERIDYNNEIDAVPAWDGKE